MRERTAKRYENPLGMFYYMNPFSRLYLNTDGDENLEIVLREFWNNPRECLRNRGLVEDILFRCMAQYVEENPFSKKEKYWFTHINRYLGSYTKRSLHHILQEALDLFEENAESLAFLVKNYRELMHASSYENSYLPYTEEWAWDRLVDEDFLREDCLPYMYTILRENLDNPKDIGFSVDFVTGVPYLEARLGEDENTKLTLYKEYADAPYLMARVIPKNAPKGVKGIQYYLLRTCQVTECCEYEKVNELYQRIGGDRILEHTDEMIDGVNTNTLH